jgi:NAD(P)-dependent dehydrogenase (short-subunit alcohol dehydrogenase family)
VHQGSLFDLSGKVAIVTGSRSRKLDACEAVAADIRAKGGAAVARSCHVGRKEELQALVDATLAEWGEIDILVCNASVNVYAGPSAEMSDQAYERVMDSNVKSVFWLCNMVLPGMAARGGGSVIIISSIGGLQGSDRLGIYSVSKAAEMQIARNIAVEYGPKNVRANCIAPGLIKTDFSRALWEDPDFYRQAVLEAPLQRIGDPDDIAAATVFLAGPGGSFMTGQTLVIDGGRLIGHVVPPH